VLAAVVEGVMDTYARNDIAQSFVTVRLATPYTRVARKGCEAHLTGGAIDAEDLWSPVRDASTISIWVAQSTSTTLNEWASREKEGDTEGPPPTVRSAGPSVQEVALRRGEGPKGTVTQPSSGGGGVEYEFPAASLQGKGPFYVLVRTGAPK